MLAHLVWQDVKQNLRPIRALPILAVAIFFAYRAVEHHDGTNSWQTDMATGDTVSAEVLYYAEGALSRKHDWLFGLTPLIAGLMGARLAAERRAGVSLSLLAKGVPRHRYILAKLLGAAVSSSLLTFAALLGFFAIVFTTWTPGRAYGLPPMWIEGPVKPLFVYSPFLHDLLVALMEMTAASGLSVIGVLAGLVVANEYVAMTIPPIAFIIAKVSIDPDLLNPEQYIFLDYDFYWGPHFRWLIPFAPFLYWGTLALIISTLCQRIAAKKEIA